jgi:hypothetical protein
MKFCTNGMWNVMSINNIYGNDSIVHCIRSGELTVHLDYATTLSQPMRVISGDLGAFVPPRNGAVGLYL